MTEYNNVCIIEGFDIVGKTTYAKEYLSNYRLYEYDHTIIDNTVGRSKAWMPGYSIIDFLSKTDNKKKIVLNRGICSSIVYNKLSNMEEIPEDIIEYYKHSKYFHDKVDILYFYHKSKSSAELLYTSSLSREVNSNKINQSYDRFNSFEDYWETYLKYESEFLCSFNLLNVNPYFIGVGNDSYKITKLSKQGGFEEVI